MKVEEKGLGYGNGGRSEDVVSADAQVLHDWLCHLESPAVFKGLHVDTAAPRTDPSIEATVQARGRFISLAAPHRLHLLPVVSVSPRFVLILIFLFSNNFFGFP